VGGLIETNMTEPSQPYKILRELNSIVDKSKSNAAIHHSKMVVYTTLEILSYLIFLWLLFLAFQLKESIEYTLQSDRNGKVALLITTPEWKQIIFFLKMMLFFMSLFPLGVGLLLRSSKQKRKMLYEIYKISSGLISELLKGK
jgi:hypothetical protein